MADHVPKLGQLCTGDEERDAVHVAVVPMEAAGPLAPGSHVNERGALVAPGTGIGIVDPFLKDRVKRGQKFWLFLYPGTVISLRHHYRHPVLDHEEIRRETIEKLAHPSKKRLEEIAEELGISYDELMSGMETYLRTGEPVVTDGWKMMNPEPPEDFWEHYELVTGKKVPASKKDKDAVFSCAC